MDFSGYPCVDLSLIFVPGTFYEGIHRASARNDTTVRKHLEIIVCEDSKIIHQVDFFSRIVVVFRKCGKSYDAFIIRRRDSTHAKKNSDYREGWADSRTDGMARQSPPHHIVPIITTRRKEARFTYLAHETRSLPKLAFFI